MTTKFEDIITGAQDQFLDALKSTQSTVLEGVKLWSGAVNGLVPTDLIKSVPGLDKLPSPTTYAALRMDFAEKLLAHQREFIEQLLAEADPATAETAPTDTYPVVVSATSATKAAAK